MDREAAVPTIAAKVRTQPQTEEIADADTSSIHAICG